MRAMNCNGGGRLNEQKTLTKLADLFHIAPSALRYWDNIGLIRFERSDENNYRYPSIQTMLDICEVLLNRSLSIPLKEMQKIPQMNAGEYERLLIQNEKKLEEQAEMIQRAIKRIQGKQRQLKRFYELRSQDGFVVEEKMFSGIKDFSFQSERDLQAFVDDPCQSAILFHPDGTFEYGLFTDENQGCILRGADHKTKRYLKGLLYQPSDGKTDSNYRSFMEEAGRRGAEPGMVFGRFLISVCEQVRYDYYEAWIGLEK